MAPSPTSSRLNSVPRFLTSPPTPLSRSPLIHQEKQMKESAKEAMSGNSVTLVALPKPGVVLNKRSSAVVKSNPPAASGGNLAFSLKQKSKIIAASVVLGANDDDGGEAETSTGDERAKRQKLGRTDAAQSARQHDDVAHVLSVHQSQWKELSIERYGNCGKPSSNALGINEFFK